MWQIQTRRSFLQQKSLGFTHQPQQLFPVYVNMQCWSSHYGNITYKYPRFFQNIIRWYCNMKNSRASSKGFKFQVGGNNIHKNQRLKKYDQLSIIIIITTLPWSWNISEPSYMLFCTKCQKKYYPYFIIWEKISKKNYDINRDW